LNTLQKEIGFRENEIHHLQAKVKDREVHCDAALVSDTLNKHNLKNLTHNMEEKDQ